MGLISGAIDAALESIGKSLLDVGEWFLETGYTLWKNAGKLTLDYVKISPMSQSGASKTKDATFVVRRTVSFAAFVIMTDGS